MGTGTSSFLDFYDGDTDPDAPQKASRNRIFSKAGVLYLRLTGGAAVPFGGISDTSDATLVRVGNLLRRAAITGDVTIAAGSNTSVITGLANSKLATMPTQTLKGNNTGGAATPVDLTAAQAKTLLAIIPADVTGFDTQVRTSRLDQLAAPTGPVAFGSQQLRQVADGTVANDVATFGQLQAVAEGKTAKDPVYAATTGNIALTGEQTLDGFLTNGSRVLVKDQAVPSQNGLYVTAAGAWTRTVDANTAAEVTRVSVLIQNGTVGQGDVYTSNVVTTLGTDPVVWVKTSEGNQTYTADNATLELVGTQFREKDGGTTNAKLAPMPTVTVKANLTGGAASPTDVTLPSLKTALAIVPADVTGFDEAVDDRVGALVQDSNTIDATYDDSGNMLSAETRIPIQPLINAASKVYTAADNGRYFRRVNAGGAMADTLPTAPPNGWSVKILNTGTTIPELITVSAGPGATFGETGAATATIKYGCRNTYVYDAANNAWRFDAGNTNLLKSPTVAPKAFDLAFYLDANGVQTTAAGLAPKAGQTLDYNGTQWRATGRSFHVETFGADPTNTADSTLAIYNAIILCALSDGVNERATTTADVTTSGAFSISVGANTLPASGTLCAMTTRGWVGFTYSGGGGTGTLTGCAITWGVSGGVLLAGSFIGVASIYHYGGIVDFGSGLYKTLFEVTNSIPGIWFRGPMGTSSSDTGTFFLSGGCFINYAGPAGGTVLRNVPITGTSGPQGGMSLNAIKITGLNFLCQGTTGYGLARYGVQMISCTGYHMEDLYVHNAVDAAYSWTTLGAASLGAGQAHDTSRGTATNLKFRELEVSSSSADAVAAVRTNPAATTNINTLAGSVLTLSSAPGAGWPASGQVKMQARDALTGSVMWYTATYTAIAGSTLTGVTTHAQWWNETNSSTLNAAAPASGNPLPNATLFAGSLIVPGQGGFGDGFKQHGSLTANSCCALFSMCAGSHAMGAGGWLGNCDDQVFLNVLWNRASWGTGTGWDVQGGTAAGGVGASRNNHWISGSAGAGGANFRGTNSFGYTSPANCNIWDRYEMGNGEPIPVVGTGASLQWSGNGLLEQSSGVVSTASVTGAASATGLIAGTAIAVPPQGLQIGTTFEWTIPISKTAAGTVLAVQVRIGATGTENQMAGFSWTGTAVADSGVLVIRLVVTSLGAAATCLAYSYLQNRALLAAPTTGLANTLAATNLAAMTPVAFNSGLTNPGPCFIGVNVTTNTGNVLTFLAPVMGEVVKAANP